MFSPMPIVDNPEGNENFIKTIAALQDPSGTLDRLQSEKVIQGMADLKTDGISGLYSQHALDAIDAFRDYSKGLYRSRKGFNRLNLSGQQQLDENKQYKELLTNINYLKELTSGYNATLKQAATDVKDKIMTPEDYHEFEKMLEEKNTGAKSIGDLPNAQALYNQFLTSKGIGGDFLLELDKLMQIPMQTGAKKTRLGKNAEGKNINILDYDPIEDVGPILQTNTRIRNGLIRLFNGDSAKTEEFIRARYGMKGETFAQNQRNIFNMPSPIKNWVPPYSISPGSKKVVFRQNKIKGFVVRNPIKDSEGKVVANTGDVVKPTEMENGMVKINVIENGKYVDFSQTDGTSIFIPSPGQVAKPIPGTIVYEGEIKEQMQSMGGKPAQDGTVDPSGYEKVGGRKSYDKLHKFKSDDPIDPSMLEDGEVYYLDGKKHVWNGTNLVPAKK